MRLLPVRHHPGTMAFVSAPLRTALSDALILLTDDDRDQEQTGKEETTQSASSTCSNHNIPFPKLKHCELVQLLCVAI
jgi:hypothetical protein